MARSKERRNQAVTALPVRACELFGSFDPATDGIRKIEKWISHAAKNSDTSAVSLMLSARINPHARDEYFQTALTIAAAHGYVELAGILIERNADVNHKDGMGWTPLMWAASYGKTETVMLLIEKGARVNDRGNEGETALELAEERNHHKTAGVLKTHGACK